MKIEKIRPEEIEERSFAIIREELEDMGIRLPQENAAVILRCIHTSADFDYAKNLVFSPGAVEAPPPQSGAGPGAGRAPGGGTGRAAGRRAAETRAAQLLLNHLTRENELK